MDFNCEISVLICVVAGFCAVFKALLNLKIVNTQIASKIAKIRLVTSIIFTPLKAILAKFVKKIVKFELWTASYR